MGNVVVSFGGDSWVESMTAKSEVEFVMRLDSALRLQTGVGKNPTKTVWFANEYVQTKHFFRIDLQRLQNFYLAWLKNLQTKN